MVGTARRDDTLVLLRNAIAWDTMRDEPTPSAELSDAARGTEGTMHEDRHSPRRGTAGWPDGRLIEAVRGDPPDDAALQALVDRYWKSLYARCHLLTQSADLAIELAQESWYRVLRARHALRADGNFPGYLTTIEPASTWYSAEASHQDYLRKHPGGYTCHFLRD